MTATPLTRDDVLALKRCTSVTFNHYSGESYLRATIRVHGEPAIYTAMEQRLFPQVDSLSGDERRRQIDASGEMYGYTANGSTCWDLTTEPKASAFYMDHFVGPDVRTVFDLLRAGDTLTLKWIGSNNNENTEAIHWHRDELRMVVARGEKAMVFLIEAQTGPDNSARMVQRYGR